MAVLNITEFKSIFRDQQGHLPQAVLLPPVATQAVDFTAGNTAAAATQDITRIVRLLSDTDCHINLGAAATTGDMKLLSGQAEYFGVQKGAVINVISA